MKDEFDYKFEILLKEMDNLQCSIRGYDSILFTIKGWSITIFSAFVFFTAQQKQFVYLIFCAAAIILFWVLDALYKSFQRSFIIRYNKIEDFIRRQNFSRAVETRSFKGFNIPDIGARVSVKDSAKLTSPWRAAFYLHTSILYIFMLLLVGAFGVWLYFAK